MHGLLSSQIVAHHQVLPSSEMLWLTQGAVTPSISDAFGVQRVDLDSTKESGIPKEE